MNRELPDDAPDWLRTAMDNVEESARGRVTAGTESAEKTIGRLAVLEELYQEFATVAANEKHRKKAALRALTGT